MRRLGITHLAGAAPSRFVVSLFTMPKCPICQTSLETTRQREGVFYPCHSCNGRAVTVSQIHHVLGERVAMKLLRLMKLSSSRSSRLCPFCEKPMVAVNNQEPQMDVDACRRVAASGGPAQ